ATLQDPAPLPFAAPAPHAVLDAVLERVVEALVLDGAAGADLAGLVDADAIAREERRRGVHAARAEGHPAGDRIGVGGELLVVPCGVAGVHRFASSRPAAGGAAGFNPPSGGGPAGVDVVGRA